LPSIVIWVSPSPSSGFCFNVTFLVSSSLTTFLKTPSQPALYLFPCLILHYLQMSPSNILHNIFIYFSSVIPHQSYYFIKKWFSLFLFTAMSPRKRTVQGTLQGLGGYFLNEWIEVTWLGQVTE
jgi:hypothetical protein